MINLMRQSKVTNFLQHQQLGASPFSDQNISNFISGASNDPPKTCAHPIQPISLNPAEVAFIEWHLKMDHINYRYLYEAIKRNYIHDFPYSIKRINVQRLPVCESDIIVKLQKKPLSNHPVPRATAVGQVFHADLKGPFSVRSIHGNYYWMIIIFDDYSSMYWIFYLRNKFEAYRKGFLRWYNHVYLQFSSSPCVMTMDSGGEFLSLELQDWFQSTLIEPHWLPANSPSMNGMVENCHKRLLRVTNCTMHYANLPNNLWDIVSQPC